MDPLNKFDLHQLILAIIKSILAGLLSYLIRVYDDNKVIELKTLWNIISRYTFSGILGYILFLDETFLITFSITILILYSFKHEKYLTTSFSICTITCLFVISKKF